VNVGYAASGRWDASAHLPLALMQPNVASSVSGLGNARPDEVDQRRKHNRPAVLEQHAGLRK